MYINYIEDIRVFLNMAFVVLSLYDESLRYIETNHAKDSFIYDIVSSTIRTTWIPNVNKLIRPITLIEFQALGLVIIVEYVDATQSIIFVFPSRLAEMALIIVRRAQTTTGVMASCFFSWLFHYYIVRWVPNLSFDIGRTGNAYDRPKCDAGMRLTPITSQKR